MTDVAITFGMLAVFFAIVVAILQRTRRDDRDFGEFAVAGRSFGGVYQAMSFLNTWFPGTIFIASAGLIASAGVVGFFPLTYSLIAPFLLLAMAPRVCDWARRFDLHTQPDLLGLRFDSRAIRVVAALIGVVSLFPWLVLGMQSLGVVFNALSFGRLGFTASVALGVSVMALRQVWTVRMGMRGVVVSDLFQGFVAYVLGSAVIVGLIAWLAHRGVGLADVKPALLVLSDRQSPTPLFYFSLVLSGVLGGLCWPDLFVRLYTGRGVCSVRLSSAIGAPLSLLFFGGLAVLVLIASSLPAVAADPERVWFTLARDAGGSWLLALAGVIVFAASMGNIDATIQSCGAQVAKDIVALSPGSGERRLMRAARIAMVVLTLAAAVVACLPLPKLFTLAVLAYQGIIQLAVPLYLGIFTRIGHRSGAIGGMLGGIATVAVLELVWPAGVPWAWGLTSGILALLPNLAIYLVLAWLQPSSVIERRRLDVLFGKSPASRRRGAPTPASARG